MADTLAIVVPTVGRSDVLLPLLGQLLASDAEEILVVDQSDGEDRARLERFVDGRDPRLRTLHRTERSLPAARNAGIATTNASLVLFFDDDVVVAEGCVAAHRAAYRDPTVGGVVGRIDERRLLPNSRTTTNRIDRGGRIRTNLAGWAATEVETLKGANMSFRRRALDEAGPFDADYGGSALLEDADLSTRVRNAGWRLRFEPAAGVEHLHLATGGVRLGGAPDWWRFHNTGRFVRQHRGRRDLPLVAATFGAIALLRAVQARDPRVAPRLVGALIAGWSGARPW